MAAALLLLALLFACPRDESGSVEVQNNDRSAGEAGTESKSGKSPNLDDSNGKAGLKRALEFPFQVLESASADKCWPNKEPFEHLVKSNELSWEEFLPQMLRLSSEWGELTGNWKTTAAVGGGEECFGNRSSRKLKLVVQYTNKGTLKDVPVLFPSEFEWINLHSNENCFLYLVEKNSFGRRYPVPFSQKSIIRANNEQEGPGCSFKGKKVDFRKEMLIQIDSCDVSPDLAYWRYSYGIMYTTYRLGRNVHFLYSVYPNDYASFRTPLEAVCVRGNGMLIIKVPKFDGPVEFVELESFSSK